MQFIDYLVRNISLYINLLQNQSPEVFYKKSALQNFAIFTEKQLRQSLSPPLYLRAFLHAATTISTKRD